MTLLRSAAFTVWFYGVTFAFCLGGLLVRLSAAVFGPQVVLAHARRWARVTLAGLRLVGITYRIEGSIDTSGAVLIAAQHQSTFETLLWAAELPAFVYVLKQELLGIPLFGGMLRASGMIALDRRGGAASMRALLRGGARAAAERRQIVIFPEGTRVPPGVRAPLHPGVAALAARTGLPVIPIVTDSGSHWPRNGIRKRPGLIRVQILPALPPGLPRAELMRRLTEAYAAGPA